MTEPKIVYTPDGLKITHPSSVVQILSVQDLERLRDNETQFKNRLVTNITETSIHITKTIAAKDLP